MAIPEKAAKAVLSSLARRLKSARLDANLTQQALADRTGMALKTVGNAEDSGQVSLDTLVRLLDGLGRLDDLNEVLGETGPSPIELARRSGRARQRARETSAGKDPDTDSWQW